MGYALGFDPSWGRDVGYGVPALCDYPGCQTKIDRGLGYVCGNGIFGGDSGCGLYFCSEHLSYNEQGQCCERCENGPTETPFEPKPDIAEWSKWKLTDPSWQAWRNENPEQVAALQAALTSHD